MGLRVYGGRCLRGWRDPGRSSSGSYAAPPHEPSLLPIHSPYLRFPCPSFPLSFSRSLSLSLSLRPPRILFPAVCPFRLSRHIFALPSPELCTFICHSPPPHCPLSAYPPRPNSCAPDIDFGAPTPPLMTWTPPNDVLAPNNFAPGPPPLMAPTSDIFRAAPINFCPLTNHWYPGPQTLFFSLQPWVSCYPSIGLLAANIGFLCPKYWPLGPKPLIPSTPTVRLLLGRSWRT